MTENVKQTYNNATSPKSRECPNLNGVPALVLKSFASAMGEHPASGPVGAPAYPSQVTGGLTQAVQDTVGGLLASVRNAVASRSQTSVDDLPPNGE